MVTTYIDEYCEEVTKQFDLSSPEINKNFFAEIQLIFEESIIKEEYAITRSVTDQLGEVFRSFLSNSIKMISDDARSQQINKRFTQIIKFNMYQFLMCEKIESKLLISHIAEQNYLNLKFCLKTNQYEWFKQYIQQIEYVYFHMQKDNNIKVADAITSMYKKLLKDLINEGKIEWCEKFINGVFEVTKQLNFINGNANYKYCAELLSDGLTHCLNKDKPIEYSCLFEIFTSVTKEIGKISSAFSKVKIYYAIVFNQINKTNQQDKVAEILNLIFNDDITMPDDPFWIEFKFFCITELNKSQYSDSLKEKINDYHIQTLLDVINYKLDYDGYILPPKFNEKLSENINNPEHIDKVCEDIYRILTRCMIRDDLPAYYYFLKHLNKCFYGTQQNNKNAQVKLFELYMQIIFRASHQINEQFLELTFDDLETCITDLDKDRKISSKFSENIIRDFVNIVDRSISDNKQVAKHTIRILFDFLEEKSSYHFAVSNNDVKKDIYRGLFNIGTHCIEDNYEVGLRNVSNSMGWLTIYSLKQNPSYLTKYLIERANELYQIAKRMDVSQKTLTYLLTLFTTIGTYCCKDPRFDYALKEILECLDPNDTDSIKTAIRLRTSENDMWNQLFDGKTSQLTQKFLKEFLKSSAN